MFKINSRVYSLYLIYIIWLGLLLLYWDTTHYLGNLWLESSTYGHGVLVFPISIYLIWRKRLELSQLPLAPSRVGLFLLALLSIACTLAYLADIQALKAVCLATMLAFSLWGVLGNRIARLIAFPLAYLIVAIPLWEPVELVLQDLTVKVAVGWLRLVEISTFKEGIFITIPEGRFEVEKLCAGLKYFLAALAIASLYAYLNLRTRWKQLSLVLVALFLSVLTNWVRVFIVIVVGHTSNMQHPLVHDHNTFGWILFSGMLVPVFLLGWIFQQHESGNPIAHNKQEPSRIIVTPSEGRILFIVTIAIFVFLSLLKLGTDWIKSVDPSEYSNIALTTPNQLGPWVKIKPIEVDWRPTYQGADLELLDTYQESSNQITMYMAYYHQQKQDKEMINYMNSVVGENYSIKPGDATDLINIDANPSWAAYETQMFSRRGGNRLVWHWYYVGGQFTVNPIMAKLLYVWDLLGSRQGSAVIAIATAYENSPENGRTVLNGFSKYLTPTHIQEYLN